MHPHSPPSTFPESDLNPGRLFPTVSPAWISLALIIGTLLLFSPARSFDFVNYDDPLFVSANEMVERGLTADGIAYAFGTTHASYWHPLTWLSHMLVSELFGMNPAAHHGFNLLIHAANAALLFLVLRRMTGATWRCAFVAALFSFHPLHVESVAWVTERKDLLSGFFWLLAMWFYAGYATKIKNASGHSGHRRDYWLTLACFGLGLLSKPMVVTFPCVLLLLDFWPLNRFSLSRSTASEKEFSKPTTADKPGLKALLLEKLPFLGLAILVSFITVWAQKKEGVVGSTEELPMLWRVGNAVVAYATYLKKTVWPVELSPLYPHPGQWPIALIALSAVLLLLITLLSALLLRRCPFFAMGWAWFLGTLVPAIGLVQVGIQSMADRYTYIPLIGIFIALAWGLKEVCQSRRMQSIAIAGSAVVLVAFSAVTVHQLQFWKNGETLFRRALNVALGDPNYRKALQTKPVYADLYINLGTAMAMEGKFDEALPIFREAQRLNPNFADVYANIGTIFIMQKKWKEGISEFERAAALNPNDPRIHLSLAQCFHESRQLNKALEHYEIALKFNPSFIEAHFNLGLLLEELRRFPEAIYHYQTILKLNPGFAPARQRFNALAGIK